MIVEDEGIQALMLEELLIQNGYKVSAIASSGEEAIQQVQLNVPDLIILDISLSGKINGIETYKIISQNYNIPVIFLTSYSQDAYVKKATIPGVYGYLLKPFREKELLANLEIAFTNYFSTKNLSDSLDTKEKIFAIISHDLKNHLVGINKTIGIIKNNFSKLSHEDLEGYCFELGEVSHNLLELTDEFSDWAISIKKYNPISIPINPKDLIERIVEIFSYQAKEKNISILNAVPPQMTIQYDKKLLLIIISNVLSNAIKFSYPDSDIKISATIKEKFTELTFQDKGVGIDKKVLKKINEGGFLEEKIYREQGTGIGLLICKDLIQKGGGKIHISSIKKTGTLVKIILPVYN